MVKQLGGAGQCVPRGVTWAAVRRVSRGGWNSAVSHLRRDVAMCSFVEGMHQQVAHVKPGSRQDQGHPLALQDVANILDDTHWLSTCSVGRTQSFAPGSVSRLPVSRPHRGPRTRAPAGQSAGQKSRSRDKMTVLPLATLRSPRRRRHAVL